VVVGSTYHGGSTAALRNQASVQEGTLYRGKWHSRKALASLYQPNQPKPTHVPLQVRMAARSRCVRPARLCCQPVPLRCSPATSRCLTARQLG